MTGRPDGGRWLASDAERARAAGAADTQVIAVDAGSAGDRVSGMVRVASEDCVLLIARTGESIDDVDLFVYADDGAVLGSDEGTDKKPTLLVCPPHPHRLFVVARIASGQGVVAIGAQRVPAEYAARVGRALSAHGQPGEASTRLSHWPALDEALAEHRRTIGSDWQEVGRVALLLDPRVPTHVSAVIDAEHCLDALVVASDEVSHVDLTVLDAYGRILGRGSNLHRDRSAIVCAAVKSSVNYEVRPHGGRGVAALLLSRSADGKELALSRDAEVIELTPMLDMNEVRAKNAQRLERAGYAAAKVVSQGSLEVGRRKRVSLDLPNGCARLDVLTGRPMRGLRVWLWANDGTLMASDRGAAGATLFACGPGGRARLDAEALLRAGPYAIELRPEQNNPSELGQLPLASSRLLTHLVARGAIQNASGLGSVTSVTLSPDRTLSVPISVPVARCADVTLALGPDLEGSEVHLIEASSDTELASGYGTYVTSARTCAGSRTPLALRAELHSIAGKGSALVSTRLVPPDALRAR